MECYFCQRNVKAIEFKNTDLLKRFLSGMFKIRGKDKTGLCAKHQRMISRAVKQARHLGILSITRR